MELILPMLMLFDTRRMKITFKTSIHSSTCADIIINYHIELVLCACLPMHSYHPPNAPLPSGTDTTDPLQPQYEGI
jgi:hypothetical protein